MAAIIGAELCMQFESSANSRSLLHALVMRA